MEWPIARNAVHRAVPQSAAFAAAVEKANELQCAGEFGESERMYNDVFQHGPRHADTLNFLGVFRIRQQRMDDAIVLMAAVANLAPDYPDPHFNAGNASNMFLRFRRPRRISHSSCHGTRRHARYPLHRAMQSKSRHRGLVGYFRQVYLDFVVSVFTRVEGGCNSCDCDGAVGGVRRAANQLQPRFHESACA